MFNPFMPVDILYMEHLGMFFSRIRGDWPKMFDVFWPYLGSRLQWFSDVGRKAQNIGFSPLNGYIVLYSCWIPKKVMFTPNNFYGY